MITVADLIRLLGEFPSDARVVTPGFDEFGICDIAAPTAVNVTLDAQERTAHGAPHDVARQGDEGAPCVLITFD